MLMQENNLIFIDDLLLVYPQGRVSPEAVVKSHGTTGTRTNGIYSNRIKIVANEKIE